MYYTFKFRASGSGRFRWTKVFKAETRLEAFDLARAYMKEQGYRDYTFVREAEKE